MVGKPQSEDVCLFEEKDSRLTIGLSKARSNGFMFIDSQAKEVSETWAISLADPTATPVLVQKRQDKVLYDVTHQGDHLYVLTNLGGATNFKLMRVPVAAPEVEGKGDDG